jgi:hypothetical protein
MIVTTSANCAAPLTRSWRWLRVGEGRHPTSACKRDSEPAGGLPGHRGGLWGYRRGTHREGSRSSPGAGVTARICLQRGASGVCDRRLPVARGDVMTREMADVQPDSEIVVMAANAPASGSMPSRSCLPSLVDRMSPLQVRRRKRSRNASRGMVGPSAVECPRCGLHPFCYQRIDDAGRPIGLPRPLGVHCTSCCSRAHNACRVCGACLSTWRGLAGDRTRLDRRTCSPACRQLAYRRRQRADGRNRYRACVEAGVEPR